MKTILVVEDEPAIGRVIGAYLRNAGYGVELVTHGDRALPAFMETKPSLVVLDVMLPGRSGWEILSSIREVGSCPVLMLTALGETRDKVTGFDLGVDDYLTKPFAGEELVARVGAILRRSPTLEHKEIRYFGDLRIDFRSHTIHLHGALVDLTPRDLSLFIYLARNPNRTFTREQLIENVWGMDYDGSDRAVDLAIKRIRKSLENWPVGQGEIRTLRGLGYQLNVNGY